VANPKQPEQYDDKTLVALIKMLVPLRPEERRRIIQTICAFFDVM
jgi:hypothetical protein